MGAGYKPLGGRRECWGNPGLAGRLEQRQGDALRGRDSEEGDTGVRPGWGVVAHRLPS